MGPKTLFELLGPLYDVDPYMFISQMAVGEKPPDITSMSCLRLLEATRIQAQPSHFVFLFAGFVAWAGNRAVLILHSSKSLKSVSIPFPTG